MMMINIQLTNYQAEMLENIIAFRVLAGESTVNSYSDDIKDEMRKVRLQIHEEMGWR